MGRDDREDLQQSEDSLTRDGRGIGADGGNGAGDGKDTAMVFGGGVVLGAALLAIVWMVVAVVNGGGSDHSPPQAAADVGRPVAGAVSTPQPSRQERCAQAVDTLSVPLEAAKPAMDQWEIHIGAMNKLVVGAITLQQATAFWDQTRIGAAHRIAAFRRSVAEMRHTGVDCPSPGLLSKAAPPALRACVQTVDAQMRAVRAARTAIATWKMHVADMERLRAGKLSPTRASAMWVAMWQRGQQQVTAYRSAARGARNADACDGVSTVQPSAPATPSTPAVPSMNMPGMG